MESITDELLEAVLTLSKFFRSPATEVGWGEALTK
jgi:hypothetical protein